MKRARVMTALVCMALGLFSVASGIDPPEKMWEKTYNQTGANCFTDLCITADGDLVLTAGNLILMDTSGGIIWSVEDPSLYTHSLRDVDEPVGRDYFICSGRCKVESGDTYSLLLQKISATGEIIWTKVYDYPNTREEGYSIIELPDGGFAVCGRVYGEGLYLGQAWILRTDANGDTLWTDVWGTTTYNYAVGIEYDADNDWLVVLALGASDSLPEWGPHLLFYSLEGDYLFGTTYPDLYQEKPRGLCTTVDGGYAFVSEYGYNFLPVISGTDCQGDLLWSYDIYGFLAGDAHGIDRTVLDDGFLVTGFAVESTWVDTGNGINGARLVRFDGDGNELWDITEGSWGDEFCAAVQLPYGGYIAAGKTGYYDGYLVRYAPETGIEGPVSPGGGILRPVTPNPSSSVFNVSVNLPEAMDVRLEVHDTAGRRVELLVDGLLQSGAHEFSWDASGLSSGCYLVRLSGIGVSETVRCVLIR